MATAAEHARTLFSAIVPNRKDLLEIAITQLTVDHFSGNDDRWRHFFVAFEWYYGIAGDVLTKRAIAPILKKLSDTDESKSQLFETTFESFMTLEASESDFRWSLDQLKEIYSERTSKDTLLRGMEIINKGIVDSRGNEIKGHVAAREFVLSNLGEIDQRLTVQEAPDGDIREESEDILDEYQKKKESVAKGEFQGIEFGIGKLDQIVGGLQPGELDFVLGYSSSGKSSLCCQMAWQAAIRQHKNVVYVTTETLRGQIRRKLICRHSKLKKFALPDGLDSKAVKMGLLTPEEEEKLKEVVFDFTNSEDYGKLRIMQASENLTTTGLKVRLQAIQREFPVDLVVVDALYILKADTERAVERSELNQKIEQAKILATTFNNGNGVPVITPWQTSRKAKEEADREKRYTMSAMAETSYAERYADIVVGLLEPTQITGRHTTLSCSVIKQRDGEQSTNFDIDVDYATCHFTDAGRTQQMANNALIGMGLGI